MLQSLSFEVDSVHTTPNEWAKVYDIRLAIQYLCLRKEQPTFSVQTIACGNLTSKRSRASLHMILRDQSQTADSVIKDRICSRYRLVR